MKKKIINGILMVALMFAATTSFVSCKDNVDDELIPVYEQLSKVKSDLEARVATIESQLNNLAGQVEANSKAIKDLQTKLDTELADIKDQLKSINNQIATLSASVDAIQKDLDGVKARLDGIDAEILALKGEIENLKAQINNLITDIQINHTVNEVVGSVILPGNINLLSLAPFYGENLTGIISFPNNVKGALVDPNGVELTANEVAGAGANALTLHDEGYITESTGNAGWIFFTVNTPDPAAFNIDEYELKVQNSVGYEAPVTFSNVKKSSYQIQWGIYHSQYIDSDPDLNQDKTFFQAQAHIAPKDLESAKFDLKKFIDFKELSTEYQNAVNEVKAAAGKKAKATALAKSVTDMVRSFFSGKMSGNNQDIKNPSWSAQKLVLQKTVDGITVEKGAAEYDLVVTAVTPLSYNSFWYLENASKVADLSQIEKIVNKVASKIKDCIPNIQLGKVTVQLTKPTVGDGTNGYLVVRSTDGTELAPGAITGEATIELEADLFNPLWDAIQDGLTDIDLSNMIQGLDKINGLPKEVDKFADRVNSYIEKMANAYVTSLNNHALTQSIAPWILFNTTNGIERLTYGTKVTPGNMQIMMTSPTEELIVPSFAKYIAVENEQGQIVQSAVLPGKTQQWTLDMNKPGKYFVILSSMDYWGFIINKKYLVEVVAPAA